MTHQTSARSSRFHQCYRQETGATISEFGVTLSIIALMVVVLIDLVGVAIGFAAVCMIAWQSARQASVAHSLPEALDGMSSTAFSIEKCGLGTFSKLQPVGGISSSGIDLNLKVTNIYTGQSTTFGPNAGPVEPIDIASNICQCSATAVCNVGPLLPIPFVPLLKDVSGLGKPARLTCTWDRAAEHPDGLISGSTAQLSGGTSSVKLGQLLTDENGGGETTLLAESSWNHPEIYQAIAAAGQTIVGEDVLQVPANKADWTTTNLTVQPGDKIWIDYRADGEWTPGQRHPGMVDADGVPGTFTLNGAPLGAMVGKLTQSNVFFLGKQQWNFAPPGDGKLGMMLTEGTPTPWGTILGESAWADNRGVMTVRIIVSR